MPPMDHPKTSGEPNPRVVIRALVWVAMALMVNGVASAAVRPMPALSVYKLEPSEAAKPVGRLDFDEKGDDPARLALSDDGTKAAVSIQGFYL